MAERAEDPPASSDVQAALDRSVMRAVRPVALSMAGLFLVFTVINALDLPGRIAPGIVGYDLALVLAYLALYRLTRRTPAHWAQPMAVLVLVLALSNILLVCWLLGDPFYTNYVNIGVMGIGSLLLSTRWLTVALVLSVGAWLPVAWAASDAHDFTRYGFTLLASVILSASLHAVRLQSARRMEALRIRDDRRRVALEEALHDAETTRDQLDDKVEERTVELRGANRALEAEIEERERAEAQARDLEAQLQEGLKMDFIGRLAGGVAHDFNNLLTTVMGNLQLAKEAGPTHEVVASALRNAQHAADRGASLAQQLLAFSRRQVMDQKPVDLVDVVRGCEPDLLRVLPPSVRLEVRVDTGPSQVLADAPQIEQVLLSLVANACDAMPRGGTITVQVGGVAREHPNRIRFSVSDQGAGMDAQVRARIFEPFFSTKEPGQGTGLALAMVYGIVTQHGGVIDVDSSPGKGSRFNVYLPSTGLTTQPALDRVPRPRRGDETVLLVEDEPSVRHVAARALRRFGYNVIEAPTGERALEVLAGRDGDVDLLLTDVVMPGMDGKELAGLILARWPHIRVLYASGFSHDVMSPDGVLPEGTEFLQKPYGLRTLRARVRRVLDAES